MRELLEQDRDVRCRDALLRHVAVHVVFGADDRLRADDLARPGEQIALGVVIAVRHHGAVQAEQRDIDRHGRTQLTEDLVAQALVGAARDEARRLGPGRGAFDERDPVRLRAVARGDDRRGTERRRFGVLAGRRVKGALERAAIDRQRRERVRLRRQRCHEHAHQAEPMGREQAGAIPASHNVERRC